MRQNVASQRFFKLFPLNARRQIQSGIHSVQREHVPMRRFPGGARTAIPDLAEVRHALTRTVQEVFSFRQSFGQRARLRGHIVQDPMRKRTNRTVYVNDGQGKTLRFRRGRAPGQCRRRVGAGTAKCLGYRAPVLEACTFQDQSGRPLAGRRRSSTPCLHHRAGEGQRGAEKVRPRKSAKRERPRQSRRSLHRGSSDRSCSEGSVPTAEGSVRVRPSQAR
jgi:hypothetical protein